jgi:hypothetical protein
MAVHLPAPTLAVPHRAMPWHEATPDGVEFVLSFEAPAKLWSSNNRMHRMQMVKLKRDWRAGAHRASRTLSPKPGHWYILASLPFRRETKRDPHNWVGTVVKAAIDGLVDSHLWPDDNSDFVTVGQPLVVVYRSGPLTFGIHGIRLDEGN